MKTPFFAARILFWFLSGILCYIYLGWQSAWLLPLFLGLIIFYFLLLFFFSKSQKRRFKNLIGFVGGIVLFLFGVLLTSYNTEKNNSKHLIHFSNKIDYYQAEVISDLQHKKNTNKVVVRLKSVLSDSIWQDVTGKVILYISQKDSTKVGYGDLLLLKGNPIKIPPPANPNEFDYKRYLSFHNTYFQHYIPKGSFQLLEAFQARETRLFSYEGKPYQLLFYAIKVRKYCAEILKEYITSPQSYSVAVALVLGVKDEIDSDLKQAYSSAGAMHVLAVSGLHVGIIMQLISMLLGSLKKGKFSKFLFAIVVILLLWGFAFITGLSASVLRAVIMYTLVITAQAFNKRTNIYNTLSVTAIILLCFDPYTIMSVGFQLSFAAVLGIVYLQPKIMNLSLLKNRISTPLLSSENKPFFVAQFNQIISWLYEGAWVITGVSLAAQITTFPIGLLYFHQFPTYFFISNLVVIPAALIIVYACVTLLAMVTIANFSSWTVAIVGVFLGKIITLLIAFLNWSVFAVEKLPFSLLQGIDISIFETWLIYTIIGSHILLYVYRKYPFLRIGFLIMLLFTAKQILETYQQTQQKSMIIYKINKHSGFNFIAGRQSLILGDSTFVNDKEKLRFHVSQNLWNKGIYDKKLVAFQDIEKENITMARNIKGQILYSWNGKTILNIREPMEGLQLKVNYLVLSNNVVKNLNDISEIEYDHLIIDASNSNYFSKKILLEAESLQIPVYSLKDKGAFVVDL